MNFDTELKSKRITEFVSIRSFKLFRNRKFRKLLNINDLEITEQDRIFNELVSSGLSLSVLMAETFSEMAKINELKNYYAELAIELTNRYGRVLIELGADEKNAMLWRKLIEMRCDEYTKLYKENRKKIGKPNKQNIWTHVVSAAGYMHIVRGKDLSNDLYKMFIIFITDLGNQIAKEFGR